MIMRVGRSSRPTCHKRYSALAVCEHWRKGGEAAGANPGPPHRRQHGYGAPQGQVRAHFCWPGRCSSIGSALVPLEVPAGRWRPGTCAGLHADDGLPLELRVRFWLCPAVAVPDDDRGAVGGALVCWRCPGTCCAVDPSVPARRCSRPLLAGPAPDAVPEVDLPRRWPWETFGDVQAPAGVGVAPGPLVTAGVFIGPLNVSFTT